MKFHTLLVLLIGSILYCGCASEQGTTIKGTMANAQNMTVHLDVKSLKNEIQSMANTPIGANGDFSINIPEGLEPGLYRLRFGAKGVDLVLAKDDKTVQVSGDLNTLQAFDYQITGSALSSQYQEKIKGLIDRTIQRPELDKFINSEADPLLSVALSLGTSPINPAMHSAYKNMAGKLKTAYPEAPITRQLETFAVDMEKQSKSQSRSKYKVDVGQPAPDIALPDVKGKVRKLSDLKGKLVLLDFWASWCGPCRRANPHVVDMYNKYNKDGFEVFNVSLDGLDSRSKSRFSEDQLPVQMERSKKRWIDAIAKDKLAWDNHVSDLKKWESEGAKLYGVRSIPTTFLIGRDGKIAALNPRNNLEEQIKKHI